MLCSQDKCRLEVTAQDSVSAQLLFYFRLMASKLVHGPLTNMLPVRQRAVSLVASHAPRFPGVLGPLALPKRSLRFDVRRNIKDSSEAVLDGHKIEAATASWHPSPFSRANLHLSRHKKQFSYGGSWGACGVAV